MSYFSFTSLDILSFYLKSATFLFSRVLLLNSIREVGINDKFNIIVKQ